MDLGGLVGHRAPLRRLGFVDLIRPVLAGADTVGGHDRGLELVSLLEFHFFGFGRAGHTRQAGVEEEEVLVSD